MASDKHMIDALSGILKDGETLMYPIFGYINSGGFQLFAYFAFTKTHLLIAYLTGKQVTSTKRIPLNITSVKIKESKLLKQYTINVLFNKNQSYTICASSKVLKIKSQKDTLPKFLEYLKSKAKKQSPSLEEIEGERICWQYFNTYIYMILAFIPVTPIIIIMGEFKKGNFDIWNIILEMSGAFPVIAVMYGIFIGPFIILSIFNRFSFGKILGVISEDVLFLENREIPIKDIVEIVYHPRVMSKTKISFSFATFVVKTIENEMETFDVFHFPIYGLRKIKKHNREIKLVCDKYIWLILCPTVLSVIIGFLAG